MAAALFALDRLSTRRKRKSFSNLNFMSDACLNSQTHCSRGGLHILETTIYIRFALFRLENRIIVTTRNGITVVQR